MNDYDHRQKLIFNYLKQSSTIFLIGPMKMDAHHFQLQQAANPGIPILIIDGGSNHPNLSGFTIGDGDSTQKTTGKLDITFEREKDFTDLEGLISLLPSSIKKIFAYGFMGGRLDHQLIVIHNFYQLSKKNFTEIYLVDENPICIYPAGTTLLNYQGTFSLLNFDENKISISGSIKYPVQNKSILPLSGKTLSNISFGEFEIQHTSPIGIYYLTKE